MKKLIFALVALCATLTSFAQLPEEIYKTYVTKTGIEKFMAERDGRSVMTEVEMMVGPATIMSKVTSKFPSFHRIELDVMGQTALIIVRDTVAYLNAAGQTQTFTGAEQIRQVAPVIDLVKDIIPTIDFSKIKLTLVGQEGKGKNLLFVVEAVETEKPEAGKTTMYFNAETGLLEKTITEVAGADGKQMKVEATFKKYLPFDDGALLLPTAITTKLPEQSIAINVKSFEVDYPTANWMFAAPKQ